MKTTSRLQKLNSDLVEAKEKASLEARIKKEELTKKRVEEIVNALKLLFAEGWQLKKSTDEDELTIYMDSFDGLIFDNQKELIAYFSPTQDDYVFSALRKAIEHEKGEKESWPF